MLGTRSCGKSHALDPAAFPDIESFKSIRSDLAVTPKPGSAGGSFHCGKEDRILTSQVILKSYAPYPLNPGADFKR